MNNKVYMSDLHFDHKLWKRQLDFQKDELSFFTNRLEEVVSRWTDKDILKQVEHFQNVFIINSNVIDELLHGINAHEDKLVERTKENPVAIDHVKFNDHVEHRDKVETQNKMYTNLKVEFLSFLNKAM